MGLPFANGHYLAFRDFPATSFSPAYNRCGIAILTVSGPSTPPLRARRAARATSAPPHRSTRWSATSSRAGSRRGHSRFPLTGLLDWRVDVKTTPATRLMSIIGSRMPRGMDQPQVLVDDEPCRGPAAWRRQDPADRQPAQRSGVPHRTATRVGGRRLGAVVAGEDLGPVGPHAVQGNLADFQLPQRGICVVAQGRFEPFDIARHRDGERLDLSS